MLYTNVPRLGWRLVAAVQTRAATVPLLVVLFVKDWRLLWSDRRAVLLSFAVPIALASLFSLLFDRPQRGEATRLRLLVAVETSGPYTEAVLQELQTSPRLEVAVVSRAAAEEAVRRQRAVVALILPAGFEEVFGRMSSPFRLPGPLVATRTELRSEVVAEAMSPSRESSVSESQKSGFELPLLCGSAAVAERFWAEGAVMEAVLKAMARRQWPQWAGEPMELTPPVRIAAVPASLEAEGRLDAATHSFCGMTVQYLLFWGMECGLLFLRERQRGIWRRLRAGPASLGLLLLARALSTASLAVLQVMATFAFGGLVFGVRVHGSWGGFVLLAATLCALSAVTGLMVAAWGGSEARARQLSILIILAMSMLGGLWLPAFLLPEWVRQLGAVLPTRWAIDGLSAVTWQGHGWQAIVPHLAVLGGCVLVFLVGAVWRLRWLEQQGPNVALLR